jgi:hypothetical protein
VFRICRPTIFLYAEIISATLGSLGLAIVVALAQGLEESVEEPGFISMMGLDMMDHSCGNYLATLQAACA